MSRHRVRRLSGALTIAVAAALLASACRSDPSAADERETRPIPASEDGQPLRGPDGDLGLAAFNMAEEAWVATQPVTEDKEIDPSAHYRLSAHSQDVQSVLLAFGKQSPYNFVIAPQVRGEVTVDLENVSLRRALDAVLDPLNLEYRIDGDFIWVQKPETEPELFTLNYVVSQRAGSHSASSAAVADGGRGRDGVGAAAAGGRGAFGGAGGGGSVSSSVSSDVFTSIAESLQLHMSEDGRVNINREAGIITVADYRQNLRRVGHFLDRLKEQLGRQVEIEAQVVEISLTKGREFGIDWTFVQGDFAARIVERTADRVLTATFDSTHLSAVLKAIREARDVQVKTAPRVLAMNNQPALVVLGEEEVYFETVETVDPETGRILRTSTVPRSVTVGVSLSVLPNIGENGEITMDVHPRITEKVDEKVGPDGAVAPVLSVREASTIARVRDGETMMIGGLITERRLRTETGVPLLSTIPVLGDALFTTHREERRNVEMVIFLTPRVVDIR